MGEPLHNYDETMKALRILADEHGLAMSPRRITLSTVGLLPALERLAQRADHAEPRHLAARADRRAARRARADQQEVRRRATSSRRASGFRCRTRSRITFEYVLLAGVNDSPEDARRLAKLLAGVKSKVNLIPLNAAAGHSVRAAVGRGDRSLRADPRRARRHGVGAQEPRPRHPRRLRTADRRRAAASHPPSSSPSVHVTSRPGRAPIHCARVPAESAPSDSSPSRPAFRPRASARDGPCRPATRGNAR